MTSKERVLRNYSFQPVDRFTIDFCASSEVYARLREYSGAGDDLALMETLHVDFRYPKPNPIRHPLADGSSVEEVNNYPYWPTAGMWDYDRYAED